jgi:hypothetical protein
MDPPDSLEDLSTVLILSGPVIYALAPKRRPGRADEDESVPYFPWMRRLTLGFFGAALVVTLLSLIIPAVWSARRAAEEREMRKEATVKVDATETIISTKSGYIVEIPGNWEEHTDPAAQINDVRQLDRANDLVFFLQSVPKEDLTYPSLEAWADETLKQMRAAAEASEIVEQTDYAAPGPPTIERVLEFTVENVRFTSVMRFIEGPEHYLWARAVATRSRFRTHEETLRRIVRSVREE